MVKIGKYVNLLFSLEVNVRVCMGMYVLLYIYIHTSQLMIMKDIEIWNYCA